MQQRRGTAAQWISTNGGNGPILNPGEIGYESDTNKFKIGDGTNHWINLDYFIDASSTVNPAFGSSITFEGATANDFETTLAITDPTADRTITFPDATGTVALTSDIAVTASSTTTFTNKTLTSPKINEDVAVTATATELNYVDGVTSAIQTQMDAKAPLASPTFTGTVTLPANTISQSMMSDDSVGTNEIGGLAVTEGKLADGAVTNAKVSASAAIAQSKIDGLTTDLGLKAPLAAPAFTGNASAVNLTISGDLTVNGTTTNLNSTSLVVEDKNIVLGDTATPTDTTADGGGITLKGATDKTFNWVDSTDSWTSSENVNIPTGKSYKVNNTDIKDVTETLTNKTLTSPKINEDVAVTATATEINTLDGITASTAELNLLDGVTASTTELNYVDGVTSAIQTQLSEKQNIIAGVSDAEIGYLSNVTSDIQSQFNSKITGPSPANVEPVTLQSSTALTFPTTYVWVLANSSTFRLSTDIVWTNGDVQVVNAAFPIGSTVTVTGTPFGGGSPTTKTFTIVSAAVLSGETAIEMQIAGATGETVFQGDVTLAGSGLLTAGKYLTNDGTTSSWATVDLTGKVSKSGGDTITVASGTTVPLTIQNNGTGNSFVVNDVASDTTPFVIDAAGNVGIGTASPTSYTTTGAAIIGTAGNSQFYAGSTANGLTVSAYSGQTYVQTNADMYLGTGSSNTLAFRTNGTNHVSIDTSGNTTINTIAAGTTTTATAGAGYMGMPQNATTTGAYTLVAADAGKHIYSTATRTITIPANATTAFPIGTTIAFIAATGATVTIAITTDTLLLAGPGTTGSRTLAAFGMATLVKITATSWMISGNGLT